VPVHGTRVAQQAAVGVDLPGAVGTAVEALGDLSRPIRVAWEEHELGIVVRLGVQVDLWHRPT
jgi:hypothetical protein